MKIYNNICGELLAIAYLPKEKRREALNDLNTVLSNYSEDDIPKEQQNLIQGIIQDLINEIGSVPENKTESKPKSKPDLKSINKIEVVEPEVIEVKPEMIEALEPEVIEVKPEIIEIKKEQKIPATIEDIDDAF